MVSSIQIRVTRAALWVILCSWVIFAGSSRVWATDTYIAPEFDLYWTHNNLLRSHFIVSGNWLTRESAFGSAWYQYDIDIGILQYFRKYLFKDIDPEKAKRVSFRMGYLQVSDLKDDPNGFDEKRPFGEFVFRQAVGRAWLFEDRNRGEYRIYTQNNDFWRYRNRLRAERAVTFDKLRLTPYASGEIFYTGHDAWNEYQTAIGIDIPWHYSMVIELECMTQFVDNNLNTVSFGFMLQKFISGPIFAKSGT